MKAVTSAFNARLSWPLQGNTRVARKRHLCDCCGCWIEPGRVYYYSRLTPWTSGDAGCWAHWRNHPACAVQYQEERYWEDEPSWDCGEFRNDLLARWWGHIAAILPDWNGSEHPYDYCGTAWKRAIDRAAAKEARRCRVEAPSTSIVGGQAANT